MAGFNRLKRSGAPRLNPLPTLTATVAATVTGHVHPPGAQVRVMQTTAHSGRPLPTAAGWSAPINSTAVGNWTTSITPAAAGPLKVWVALVRNPTNMWGMIKTVL